MAPCVRLWEIFHSFFLQTFARQNLISLKELVLAGDGTPVYTAAQERKNEPAKAALRNALAKILVPMLSMAEMFILF